ncbi:MAG: hypothetical protein ACHQU0_03560 [Candidatus Paceibacteria bacterium]
MSNHTDSSIEWYINWLAENRPDLRAEQRVELATGFVQSQQPPTAAAETDDDTDDAPTEEQLREEARANERKNRKYLTGDELMKILATPGEAKAPN